MNIFTVLAENFRHAPRTRLPADLVPEPEGLRGALVHAAQFCVGCGSCAYVCSPGAIDLTHAPSGLPDAWRYFAGQCTFCGRCVEYCQTGALSFARAAPPVTADQGEHRVEHRIASRPCPRCGRPVIPLPAALLAQLYRTADAPDVAAMRELCESCRARTTGERFLRALAGRHDG